MNHSKALSALDKLGAVGAFLSAAAAPCCFPLFAGIGAALGLSSLQFWRGYMDYTIQGFVLLSIVGNVFVFRRLRQVWPLGIALTSGAFIFFAFYISYFTALIYAGLAGLAVVAVWNIIANRRTGLCCKRVELQSTITCPDCGHQKTETMPTDLCLYFYECQNCQTTLRPKPGHCCVFCSYGSVKCPPVQSGGACCAT